MTLGKDYNISARIRCDTLLIALVNYVLSNASRFEVQYNVHLLEA